MEQFDRYYDNGTYDWNAEIHFSRLQVAIDAAKTNTWDPTLDNKFIVISDGDFIETRNNQRFIGLINLSLQLIFYDFGLPASF